MRKFKALKLFILLNFFQVNLFARVVSISDFDNELPGGHSKGQSESYEEQAIEYSNTCPSFLVKKINNDASSNLRNWNLTKAGNYDYFCAGPVNNLIDLPSPKELSNKLSSHDLTKLGNNKEKLSEECINSIDDEGRKNFFIAEYYSNMARLKVGTLASLENLQAIDSVLGESSLLDESCSSMGHSLAQSGCKKLKECKPLGGLGSQAKELEEIYPDYLNLKKEIDSLRSQTATSFRAMGPGFAPSSSIIAVNSNRINLTKEKEKQVELIEALYPALKGKAFNRTFNPAKQNFKEALESQLRETRKIISGELKELQSASDCMRGQSSKCDGFDRILKKTPPLNVKAFQAGENITYEDAQVQTYLNAADCFQKVRKAGDNQGEAISSFITNSALVVLTMGLSSYASYGRIAYLSSHEAKAASLALNELPKVASKAKMASNAALGFDIFSLGKGGVDAYQKCSKDLNQLTHHGLNKKNSEREVMCAKNTDQSLQPQLVADYRACVYHSIFSGASSILLPKSIKKAIEGSFKGLTKGMKKGIGETGKLNDKAEKNLEDEGFDEYSGSRRPASD